MPSPAKVPQASGKPSSGVDLVQNYLDTLLREVGAPAHLTHANAIQKPMAIADLAVAALQPDAKTERVVPDWAKQDFVGLLFDVAGLKMAAPIHALGGIGLLAGKLQPVLAQADWFMGVLRWNGRSLRVIDTARFVMPEELDSDAHLAAYQSVIVLGDSQWALAIDCANESVLLKPDDIRWNQLTGARPWLAGTLPQRLCVMLDVDNLMNVLVQHEQQMRKSLGSENTN
jgi:chemotaxis signal transduction protein